MSKFFFRFFQQYECALGGYRRILEDSLPETGRLLDLGCGSFDQLSCYRTRQREVWGCDVVRHPELQHSKWFRMISADGSLPFEDRSVDLIGCCWVLEHVERPTAFFCEVDRILRPGGAFVALTPNSFHYVAWIVRAARLLPHPVVQKLIHKIYGRPHEDTFETHYRLNSLRSIERALGDTCLKRTQFTRFASPDYFRFHWLARNAAIVLDWSLTKIHPALGNLYSVVVIRKHPIVVHLDSLQRQSPGLPDRRAS